MNFFNVISSKFYNELRNKSNFSANLTDFTETLVGNAGETIQLIRVVNVETSILAVDFGTFSYDAGGTYGTFTFTGDWFQEGLSVGATVDIIWDGNTVSETVHSVTGNLGTVLNVTKANLDLAGLLNDIRSDFEIRVTSAPDRVTYKYGLNQLNASTNNYQSPFDNNQQAYYNNAITGSYQTLTRIGNDVSWDLGTVEIKFNGTSSSYIHEFEIRHTFKIPDYVDGQLNNIQDLITPQNLIGTNSFKYGYGLFLAETNTNYNRILEDVGVDGSVGYYNENFNGFANDYEIIDLVISNSYNSQTLEGTDTNTVTFQIKNNGGNFVANQEVIIKHKKLPIESEYQNKTDSFDDIWLVDSLETEVGFVGISSTIITACSVVLNADPTLLDVGFTVSYSVAQQLLIEDNKNWLMSVLIDDNSLAPDITNRVDLKIDSQLWSFDNDIQGLMQNNDIRFFNSSQNIVTPSSSEPTDFTGWNGDFMGVYFNFETRAEQGAWVKNCVFRLIAFKNNAEQFEISSTTIQAPVPTFTNPDITTYRYQYSNINTINSFNITPTEDFNRIQLISTIPVYGSVWQQWRGELAFEINWRDWIENIDVDNIFIDYAELNNNKNERTSNYSALNGYEIYGVVDVTLGSLPTSSLKNPPTPPDTIYRITSDISTELDFDVSGGDPFTGTTTFLDINGNAVDNIYSNQEVTIKIDFDNALGLLPKVGGDIFIEPENGIGKVWRLSTHKDWSNPLNPLAPSDTLLTGNTTLIEIVNVANKVTWICKTNHLNLDPNINYNVVGRLFNT